MNTTFAFVVGLLQAALTLLGFIHANPSLPQAQQDQAQQVAMQAISQATQALSTQSLRPVGQTNTGSLSVSSTSGTAPLPVTFSVQPTANGPYIDFGDGSDPCSSTAQGFTRGEGGGCVAPTSPQTFTHTYTSPGVYKVVASRFFPSTTLGTATITVASSNQSAISVLGMSKYTDADFGFSFWYPTGWTVSIQQLPASGHAPPGSTDRTVVISSNSGKNILIKTGTSLLAVMGDSGTNGSESVAYAFDDTTHSWMVSNNNEYPYTRSADVSKKTMGGLLMFDGVGTYEPMIPLGTKKGLFIRGGEVDSGNPAAVPLAKTIVATDPSVATPVSAAQQQATIQAEQQAYAEQ
jgi:hypothetical protein